MKRIIAMAAIAVLVIGVLAFTAFTVHGTTSGGSVQRQTVTINGRRLSSEMITRNGVTTLNLTGDRADSIIIYINGERIHPAE